MIDMLKYKTEIGLAVLVLIVLIGVPVWVVMTEADVATVGGPDVDYVFTLTGVSDGGIWTEEDVVGHSYWRSTPQPARLVVEAGKPVILRLKSADVTHGFSIPDLEIGPMDVEAGHVLAIQFEIPEPGEYLIQCGTWCGECHEEMLSTIVALGPGQTLEDYPGGLIAPRTKCPLH